ncbi:MAG: hypothetical protein R3B06_07105 [Kofleriaceae bacterium]
MIGRVGLAVTAIVAAAQAVAAAPRVAVVGDDAAAVAAVRAALGDHVEAVAVDAPAAGPGVAAMVLAEPHQLAAVVVVTTSGRKDKPTVTAVVYQGVDGAEVARVAVRERRRRLAGALAKVTWRRLGRAIDAARPQRDGATAPAVTATPEVAASVAPRAEAPSPSAAPSVPSPPASTDAGPRGAAGATPARLRVAIDQRPFWRRLRYNDDYRLVTRDYDLAADAVGVEVVARPIASLPRLEVVAAGQLAVAVKGSRTSDGTAYATKASAWSAELGYRVAPAVAVRAGYGEHRFHIDDDPAPGPELVPDATYRYVRLGVEATLAFGPRWRLTGDAGGRYLVGTGDLTGADWFPRATGRGVDGAAQLGYQTGRLMLYARVDARHYFFAMHPEVGDAMIVGGAVDTYLSAGAGAAVAVW